MLETRPIIFLVGLLAWFCATPSHVCHPRRMSVIPVACLSCDSHVTECDRLVPRGAYAWCVIMAVIGVNMT